MKPEDRAKHLMTLLGQQGGTIHDACAKIGLGVDIFLYGDVEFSGFGGSPCVEFIRGHNDATEGSVSLDFHNGDLQYWYGAISALNLADA